MAITVNQTPTNNAEIVGAHQKLIYRATSDNVSETNFKYLVQVHDNSGTEIGKFYISPNPADKMMFDLHDVIRSEISPDFAQYSYTSTPIHKLGDNVGLDIFSKSRNGCKKFTVYMGEAYDVSGVFTDFSGLANDPIYLVGYNHSIQDGFSPNPNNYFLQTTNGANNVMSDMPLASGDYSYSTATGYRYRVRDNDWHTISFVHDDGTLTGSSADSYQVEYKIYNGETQLGSTRTQVINGAAGAAANNSTNPEDKLIHLGVGPANLSSLGGLLWTSTDNPTTQSSWTHYNIKITDTVSAAVYREMTFVRQEPACVYDGVRLAWVNSKGGWDYFNFTKKDEAEIQIQRKQYRQLIGTYGGSTFDFDTWDRGTTDYHNFVEKVWTIRTDWLFEYEFLYLSSLVRSKNVFILDGADMTPVVVDTNNHIERRVRGDNMYNLELKIKLAQPIFNY